MQRGKKSRWKPRSPSKPTAAAVDPVPDGAAPNPNDESSQGPARALALESEGQGAQHEEHGAVEHGAVEPGAEPLLGGAAAGAGHEAGHEGQDPVLLGPLLGGAAAEAGHKAGQVDEHGAVEHGAVEPGAVPLLEGAAVEAGHEACHEDQVDEHPVLLVPLLVGAAAVAGHEAGHEHGTAVLPAATVVAGATIDEHDAARHGAPPSGTTEGATRAGEEVAEEEVAEERDSDEEHAGEEHAGETDAEEEVADDEEDAIDENDATAAYDSVDPNPVELDGDLVEHARKMLTTGGTASILSVLSAQAHIKIDSKPAETAARPIMEEEAFASMHQALLGDNFNDFTARTGIFGCEVVVFGENATVRVDRTNLKRANVNAAKLEFKTGQVVEFICDGHGTCAKVQFIRVIVLYGEGSDPMNPTIAERRIDVFLHSKALTLWRVRCHRPLDTCMPLTPPGHLM